MPILSILIIYLLGLVVLLNISKKFSILECFGLSFPIGLGLMSLYVFVISILSIPINRSTILLGILFMTLIGVFFIIKKGNVPSCNISQIKDELLVKLKDVQLIWVLGICTLLYILYAVGSKSMYWPTIHYDSIAGYDFLAKAIAHEQTLFNSVFDLSNRVCSYRTLYPPLFPIAFAYAYIMGFELAKIITTLFVFSLAALMYSFSRKFINPVGSIFFTLFVMITPEMLAQSAMLMTNVPQAVYTLGGVGAFFVFMKNSEQRYFSLSVVMCALGVWSRSEGIVFAATVGLFLLIFTYSQRHETKLFSSANIKQVIWFALPSIGLFIVWELFLKYLDLDVLKQPFTIIPFYDQEKITLLFDLVQKITFETTYYGYIIYTFFIVLCLNVVLQIYKKKLYFMSNMWVLYIFMTVFLYLLIYYQIETSLGTFRGYILNGYKRGLFNFIPLLALYMCSTKPIQTIFSKLYFPVVLNSGK